MLVLFAFIFFFDVVGHVDAQDGCGTCSGAKEQMNEYVTLIKQGKNWKGIKHQRHNQILVAPAFHTCWASWVVDANKQHHNKEHSKTDYKIN